MKLQKIKNKNIIWEKITKPTKKELVKALKKYKFHPLHLQSCLPPLQRPRLEEHENYLFLILTFPFYNKKTKEIDHVELDFFIGHNYIITIQDHLYQPIDKLFEQAQKTKDDLENIIDANPGHLLYEILNESLKQSFPLLNEINLDIEYIEGRLFNGMGKAIIKDILSVKRNIVNFRKSITAHKSVIRRLLEKSPRFFYTARLEEYFNELVNYTKEIWDSLENYKDTINALQQSHDSLHSWRLNEIIKTLTIFSVIIFPLTLIATLFGIDTRNGMPFINSPYDFWKVVGLLITVAGLMLLFFKKKKWL